MRVGRCYVSGVLSWRAAVGKRATKSRHPPWQHNRRNDFGQDGGGRADGAKRSPEPASFGCLA